MTRPYTNTEEWTAEDFAAQELAEIQRENESDKIQEEVNRKAQIAYRICPDCGERGELKGHMGCQYPS